MSAIPTTPDVIGPYKVIRDLAKGGMATVFEVEDPDTGQRLALKLLTQRGLARPRFLREYQALTRLDHPHIVRVYRFGLDEDQRPWLTMELLEGAPAQVYAKSLGRPGTPRRTAEVIRVAREIAGALAYLHDRGIVHRDLKSSNVIVLDQDKSARLLDFGTARWLEAHDPITRHGEFVGTFAYAPPEQLTGGAVDARSDLYALGVLLYRLLTGKRPFNADNPEDLARQHLEHVPSAPCELAAGVPASISALVLQLLSKDPDGRPASAWVVADQLAAAAAGPSRDAPSAVLPELIGRDPAVRRIEELLDDGSPGAVALLIGDEGSGRERLLQVAKERAERRAFTTHTATFDGGEGLEAVARLCRRASHGLALLPGTARPLAELSVALGEDDADAVGGVLAALLCVHRDHRPGSVLLALGRLDRAGTAALQALAVTQQRITQRGLPVAILGTCGAEAAGPGGVVRRRLRGARDIPLDPLDTHQMARLVWSVLGRRPAPPGLARRLHYATGGRPGHAVGVLHAMIHEGLVVREHGVDSRQTWQDRSGGRVAIPSRLRANLQLRIDGLQPAGRRVLDAVATAALPTPRRALAAVTELDPHAVARAVEDLEGTGLVTVQGDRLVLTLGLVGQLVREQLRDSRRRVLRLRLAEALRDAAPGEQKIRLMLDAGEHAIAASDALVWAEERLAAGDAGVVLAVLTRLLQATGDALDDPTRARLLLLQGSAAARVSPGDPRASRALDEAAERSDPQLRARIDLEQAILARRAGQLDRCRQLLARARHRLERFPDPDTALALRRQAAAVRAHSGDAAAAAAAWRRAAIASEAAGAGGTRARCAVEAAREDANLGRLSASHDALRGAWLDLRALSDEPGIWAAAAALGQVLRLQGRLSEATEIIEPLVEPARTWGSPHALATLLLEAAACRTALLQFGEVRDLLGEVDALSSTRSRPWLQVRMAEARAEIALASEDADAALDATGPGLDLAERCGFVARAHTLRALHGEALALRGERDVGAALCAEAAAGLQQLHQRTRQADATARWCRALGPGDDPAPRWSDLDPWLAAEPALPLRLSRALLDLQHAEHTDQADRADRAREAARAALDRLEEGLSGGDASALAVHPWRLRLDRKATSNPTG